MSVCTYVYLSVRFRGKRDFLGPYIRQSSHFLYAHSCCISYEHLFYKYLVRRSVSQAKKGKRASLFMDVVILVIYLHLVKILLTNELNLTEICDCSQCCQLICYCCSICGLTCLLFPYIIKHKTFSLFTDSLNEIVQVMNEFVYCKCGEMRCIC